MSYEPGLCPKCSRVILASEKEAFVKCPLCDEEISSVESIKDLREFLSRPDNISAAIAVCIKMVDMYDVDIPLAILSILHDNFPMNEEVMFLIVKYTDFRPAIVRDYLNRFKNVKKKVAFAEEFLMGGLVVRNMEFHMLFADYIKSKLPYYRQGRFNHMINELREIYTKTSTSKNALGTLYAFYGVGVAINLALVIVFFLADIRVLFSGIIALVVLAAQILVLYLHNKVYGNRLEITSETERLLMILYMCSIPVTIAAIFLGGIIG